MNDGIKIITLNRSGRKFMCYSSDDEYLEEFRDHFAPGKIYYEAIFDGGNENDIKEQDNIILLINDYGLPMYVESNGFIVENNIINNFPITIQMLN